MWRWADPKGFAHRNPFGLATQGVFFWAGMTAAGKVVELWSTMGSSLQFETAENRERKDDILVFAFCDGSMEILADFPQEAGDAPDILGVVGHGKSIISTCSNGNHPKPTESRGTDRSYRIGQDKPVFVHKLLRQETVEERIHKLQQEKGNLADGILANADISNRLDAAMVRALLEG